MILNYIKDNNIIEHGEFKLSCGKTTDTYFNCKKLILDSKGLKIVIPPLLHRLGNIDAIGGLELGAVPLIGACLMYSSGLKGFVVRKKTKEYGTKNKIEGPVEKGMTCAIVEDVSNTGESMLQAVKAAQDHGMKVKCVASIINRQEGADELFELLGIPFHYLITKECLSLPVS
jgi:orotate phosphoribosyltransferase